MRTPGQAAYEAWVHALGLLADPWEALDARTTAAWNAAGKAAQGEKRTASGSNFAAVHAILEEAQRKP